MNRFVSAFASFLLLAAGAIAQDRPAINAAPNTIYVSAEGRFEAAPDTADLQFNISAQENSAKSAYERGARSAEQVRQLLRNAGIDPAEAQFGFFALTPVYDYRSGKRKIVAYRANSSVRLKLKDFSKVAPVIEQLATLDVTQNQTLNYTLENIDAAKLKAVEDAFQRARAEAATVARAGSRTLGDLGYASVDTSEEVVPLVQLAQTTAGLARKAAYEAPTEEFAQRTVTITARVNAAFGLR